AQQGVGLVQARQGDAQVVVGVQRFFHQLREQRVAQTLQEGVVEGGRGGRGSVVDSSGRLRGGAAAAESLGHGQVRPHVVGADRACRKQRDRQGGDREPAHHGSDSPR